MPLNVVGTDMITDIESNTTTGPVISICAHKIDEHAGLDAKILSTKDKSEEVWVTVCLGNIQNRQTRMVEEIIRAFSTSIFNGKFS